MKKLLPFMFVLLIGAGVIFSQSITVIQPNGGENWIIGSTHNITWTSSGMRSGLYKIVLRNGNTFAGVIATDISISTNSIPWKVGQLKNGTMVPEGSNYKIKIRRVIQKTPNDFSDGFFKIKKMKFKKFPKQKFWDLYIDYIVITPWQPYANKICDENHPNNQVILVSTSTLNPSQSSYVTIRPCIGIKTLPKSKITKTDVAKWGSPKWFKSKIIIRNAPGQTTKTFGCFTPKFTWSDVQTWPEGGKIFKKKDGFFVYRLKKYQVESIGGKKFRVAVWLDINGEISETNELNNNNPNYPYLLYSKGSLPIRIISPSPTGGDHWQIGTTEVIKWKASGITKKMKIELWKGAGTPQHIGVIADNIIPPPPNTAATLTYSWHVGHLMGGKVTKPGKNYWIRIILGGYSTNPVIPNYGIGYFDLYVKLKFK